MGSMLIQMTHGPDTPTPVAVGCLVALAACQEGHQVTLFFVGESVHFMKDQVMNATETPGLGSISESILSLVAQGVSILVSRASSTTRGVTEADLGSKQARFATPKDLVEQAFSADRVITY
ncbi:MAG TPA: DsrE family protein [Acidimicrobiia bacterium]|nr:DsrE family protein [Acidimicrobiia bacterium]